MAAPNDGSGRLFVIEQSGKIKVIKDGAVLPAPFLNISAKLDGLNIGYSEKGLLGLAFDPDYKNNGRFYVYYSAPTEQRGYDHESVIARYTVSSNPDVASTQEEIILRIPEPESNHNGGCLQFGKDGYLYIGVGDGGGAGDKHGKYGNGQNLNTLLGKILQIDVRGTRSASSGQAQPYGIPSDNPFINGQDIKPEIYAYGLRNPWHFSFDKSIGVLYCGDVGQDKWEEIDIIEKGKNYGWRVMEGRHCYKPESNCDMDGLTMPTVNDNIGMQYDFRSVYSTILSDWLCVPQADLNQIMLQNFQLLPLVDGSACTTDIHEVNKKAGENLVSCYPNPFTERTNVTFTTHGGHTLVQVFTAEGQLIKTLVNGEFTAGTYKTDYENEGHSAGLYYLRLQNESLQQVKNMMVVR